MSAAVAELFQSAMSSLASGVAIVTARHEDGTPCGLAATSVASYSAHPPSVIVSIAHRSRCHPALEGCERFGVHILGAHEEALARVFAGRGEDKFAGIAWTWDEQVPHLDGSLAYLRCLRSRSFDHHDHTVLIGDIEAGTLEEGEPLLYARRRMDWLLSEPR